MHSAASAAGLSSCKVELQGGAAPAECLRRGGLGNACMAVACWGLQWTCSARFYQAPQQIRGGALSPAWVAGGCAERASRRTSHRVTAARRPQSSLTAARACAPSAAAATPARSCARASVPHAGSPALLPREPLHGAEAHSVAPSGDWPEMRQTSRATAAGAALIAQFLQCLQCSAELACVREVLTAKLVVLRCVRLLQHAHG
jgi:hypothetical protein